MELFKSNTILCWEPLLSLGVESFKWFTNETFGHELSLETAHLNDFGPIILVCTAVACITFAHIADNSTGKYYVTLIGLICLAASTTLCFIPLYTLLRPERLAHIFQLINALLIIYIATSPTRNTLVLDQTAYTRNDIRSIIFVIVFLRNAWRCLVVSLIVFRPFANLNYAIIFFATLITLSYMCFFMIRGGDIYFEPLFRNIVYRCIKCIRYARQVKQKVDKWAKRMEIENEEVEPKPAKKKRVRFQDETSVDREKTFWGYIEVKNEPRKPDESKKQGFLEHWLHYADSHSPRMAIQQTDDLLHILPWLIPGVFISIFMFYLQILCINQVEYIGWNKFDAILPLTLFELVLFLPAEFILTKFVFLVYNVNDLYQTLIGYFCLIVASILIIVVQLNLENGSDYMPSSMTTHLRIFNADNESAVVSSNWFPTKPIEPFQFFTKTLNIDANNVSRKFSVISRHQKTLEEIVLFEKRSMTYVIFNGTLIGWDQPDPDCSSSGFQTNSSHLAVYLVPEEPKINATLVDLQTNSKTFIDFNTSLTMYPIKPSRYKVIISLKKYNERIECTSFASVSFKQGQIKGLIVYIQPIRADLSFSIGTFFKLEGHVVNWVHLIPQMVLISLGGCISTVPFIRFLYIESPSKMRSTIFSVTVSLALCGVAILNTNYFTTPGSRLMTALSCINTLVFTASLAFVKKFPFRQPPKITPE